MQRAAAGMQEDDYRALIYGLTCKTSCSDLSLDELFKVFDQINLILLSKGRRPFFFKTGNRNTHHDYSFNGAVEAKAKRILGDDWQSRLDGYIAKMGKKSLAECADADRRRVMAWLSAVERRLK